MEEKILTHIVVNDEEYQIGGGVDLSNYYTKEEIDDKVSVPDWNADEGEVGYIKNKPFGEIYNLIYKNENFTANSPSGNGYGSLNVYFFNNFKWGTSNVYKLVINDDVYNNLKPTSNGYLSNDTTNNGSFVPLNGDATFVLMTGNGGSNGTMYFKEPIENGKIYLYVLGVVTLDSKYISDDVKVFEKYNSGIRVVGNTKELGIYSFAENTTVTASGEGSHAEGYNTTASGNYSHAEGNNTMASGFYSHTEGSGTIASGECSHAEGNTTTARGGFSHAEGRGARAYGDYSHAEGNTTTASGWNSHTEGSNTSATTECEHASGKYNISLSGSSDWGHSGNTLFTVGNGCVIGHTVNTHNTFEIRQNGDIYIADTTSCENYYEAPMVKLQDAIGNADWNAEEGEVGFIKNRPFGINNRVLFDGDLDMTNLGPTSVGGHNINGYSNIHLSWKYSFNYPLINGKEYKVIFGEEELVLTATTNQNNELYIGDATYDGTVDYKGLIGIEVICDKCDNSYLETIIQIRNLPEYNGHIVHLKVVEKNSEEDVTQIDSIYLPITQETGTSETLIMSQKAVTDALNDKVALIKTENNGAYMNTCTVTGVYAVAEGSGTTASGDYSHAEGYQTKAIGESSHAEGSGTTVNGHYSHGEGKGVVVDGVYSHAEGLNTTASTPSNGAGAHAEGWGTRANGSGSHAEGWGTLADSAGSHAEGQNTKVNGKYSHAEGGGTSVPGAYSHAEGSGSTVSGWYSHAEGLNTVASGWYGAHAEGQYTSARTESEHASGKYNVSLINSTEFGDGGNTLFTVGNGGLDQSDKEQRHNALQIMQNGDIYIADTNDEGAYYEKPMIKLQEVIKQLQDEIAELKSQLQSN